MDFSVGDIVPNDQGISWHSVYCTNEFTHLWTSGTDGSVISQISLCLREKFHSPLISFWPYIPWWHHVDLGEGGKLYYMIWGKLDYVYGVKWPTGMLESDMSSYLRLAAHYSIHSLRIIRFMPSNIHCWFLYRPDLSLYHSHLFNLSLRNLQNIVTWLSATDYNVNQTDWHCC